MKKEVVEKDGERHWITNQVVWSRWPQGGKDLWYPALIIDTNDSWSELKPTKPNHQHVLWLGDGRISRVAESNVRDFCQHFNECFPGLDNREKYLKATKIIVCLAATRANEEDTFEDSQWVEWAMKNMQRFIELSVSDRFYGALHRREESQPVSSNKRSRKSCSLKRKRFENNSNSSWSGIDDTNQLDRYGELVWTSIDNGTKWWPSVILDAQTSDGSVTVEPIGLGGAVANLPEAMVLPFGPNFAKIADSNQSDDIDDQYWRAVRQAVMAIAKGPTEETEWLVWAKSHLHNRDCIVLKTRQMKLLQLQLSATMRIRRPHLTSTNSTNKIVTSSTKRTKANSVSQKKRRSDDGDLEKIASALDRGWKREICYRKTVASICKRVGDVYYTPPTGGKKLRSGREVADFLEVRKFSGNANAEEFAEIGAEHFSFRDSLLTGHANESTRRAI